MLAKTVTLPLFVTEGMLLTLAVALSLAMQLLEAEDVVDATPVVTDGFTLSTFMFMLAKMLMSKS